jgi:hypothetical protein
MRHRLTHRLNVDPLGTTVLYQLCSLLTSRRTHDEKEKIIVRKGSLSRFRVILDADGNS